MDVKANQLTEKSFGIGIDLGGTKTEAILLDPDGRENFRKRVPTPRQAGSGEYRGIIENTCGLIAEVLEIVPRGCRATIGIGTPGCLDPATGLLGNSNTNCLNGRPLQTDIESAIGRPVGLANDANCFALAESLRGAARNHRTVFGIIMGTGCGGGICIDGSIHNGRNGIGGEWGHVSIDPRGEACYCGNRGCIETKISGPGVERAFFSRHNYRLKMEEIVRGFRNGVPACALIFEQFLEDFGRALGGLVSILDPDAVVLGGGLSEIDELYSLGAENMRRYAFHGHAATPVLKNRLGNSAGVFGAAWIGR